MHGVGPFPFLRESLEKLTGVADMMVCSATPGKALKKEWDEHAIGKYVSAICGQEAGTKKETLGQAAAFGYAKDKVLMIGDGINDVPVLPSKGDHPERNLVRSQEQDALLRFIRRLPAERQNLLILKFVENMSNAEIGSIMGRSEGAVKSLYHRTLLALRDQLGDQNINLDNE